MLQVYRAHGQNLSEDDRNPLPAPTLAIQGLLPVIDPSYAPTLLGVPYSDVPDAIKATAAKSVSSSLVTPLVDDIDHEGLVSTLDSASNVAVLPDGQVAAIARITREGFPQSMPPFT